MKPRLLLEQPITEQNPSNSDDTVKFSSNDSEQTCLTWAPVSLKSLFQDHDTKLYLLEDQGREKLKSEPSLMSFNLKVKPAFLKVNDSADAWSFSKLINVQWICDFITSAVS